MTYSLTRFRSLPPPKSLTHQSLTTIFLIFAILITEYGPGAGDYDSQNEKEFLPASTALSDVDSREK